VNARGYARALKEAYGIDSILVYPAGSSHNNQRVIAEMVAQGYWVQSYRSLNELHDIARFENVTHSYFMNNGMYSPLWMKGTKRISHAVFRSFEPFGDVYAYCSRWLLKRATSVSERLARFRADARGRERDARVLAQRATTQSPYTIDFSLRPTWVPHCVYPLAGDRTAFRRKIAVPSTAPLVGRIGGRSEFSDPAAQKAVGTLVESLPGVFFCFVNTEPFLDHPRVKYVDYLNEQEKWDFYAAGYVFLNGRLQCESFGFSIVEPLMVGKPVIGPSPKRNRYMDRNHVQLLREFELLYSSSEELVRIVSRELSQPTPVGDLVESVQCFRGGPVAERFRREFLSNH